LRWLHEAAGNKKPAPGFEPGTGQAILGIENYAALAIFPALMQLVQTFIR
jgi:hypothetical protein